MPTPEYAAAFRSHRAPARNGPAGPQLANQFLERLKPGADGRVHPVLQMLFGPSAGGSSRRVEELGLGVDKFALANCLKIEAATCSRLTLRWRRSRRCTGAMARRSSCLRWP